MRAFMALGASAVLLAACGPQPAVISDINDSSVKVMAYPRTPKEAVRAEANRGCATYGKVAQPMSYQCVDEYCWTKQVLYACK